MNVEKYMSQVYETPPCWELVADVYANELGFKCPPYKSPSGHIRSIGSAFAMALVSKPHGIVKLDAAADMSIVLLGKTPKLGLHHCGIYWQGSLLHALPHGNVCQDMATIRDEYQVIEYWGCQ